MAYNEDVFANSLRRSKRRGIYSSPKDYMESIKMPGVENKFSAQKVYPNFEDTLEKQNRQSLNAGDNVNNMQQRKTKRSIRQF